jgi:hypothetical protein
LPVCGCFSRTLASSSNRRPLGFAAILEDRDRFAGRHVVTIVCGSNVDMVAYRRWVNAAARP